MTLATLSDVLQPAYQNGHAVAGLVCLGWEDARAYTLAAQEVNSPVILQAGPSCRAHTPLPVLGKMFRTLAADVDVPVVAHLDHGYELDEIALAIDSGFTSVMFDGSRKSMAENIELTQKVVEMAKPSGASVEGEIGFVGYADGEGSDGTIPAEAHEFARESGVDAMAVSVGNVHLQQEKATKIDRARLAEIANGVDIPLVIHGGSGVVIEDKIELSKTTKICKWNIGTELRMAFGAALREAVNKDPNRFDRVSILKETIDPVKEAAKEVISAFR